MDAAKFSGSGRKGNEQNRRSEGTKAVTVRT